MSLLMKFSSALVNSLVLLGENKVTDTDEVGELGVSVDVHLDDSEVDGGGNLLLGGTGTSVEAT